jgi:DNA-binding XRE family transcriptional regulator
MSHMLRSIRKSHAMTQGELAKKLGTTTRVVGSWEREETAITFEDAINCCIAPNCTPNELAGWPTEQAPETATPFEPQLVELYREADGGGRQTIMNVAASLAQTRQVEDTDAREVKGA